MMSTADAVVRYARLVNRFGIDSPHVHRLRQRYAAVPRLPRYVDALRTVRLRLSRPTRAVDRALPVEDRWEC